MGLIVKFVLVVLVVVVVLWLMLGRRRGEVAARRKAAPDPAQAMLACAHCGLHLPASDAVRQGTQVYCSEAHRALGARPPEQP